MARKKTGLGYSQFCENCGAASCDNFDDNGHKRECRRHAPINNNESMWPIVNNNDWCMEWIKRK